VVEVSRSEGSRTPDDSTEEAKARRLPGKEGDARKGRGRRVESDRGRVRVEVGEAWSTVGPSVEKIVEGVVM